MPDLTERPTDDDSEVVFSVNGINVLIGGAELAIVVHAVPSPGLPSLAAAAHRAGARLLFVDVPQSRPTRGHGGSESTLRHLQELRDRFGLLLVISAMDETSLGAAAEFG